MCFTEFLEKKLPMKRTEIRVVCRSKLNDEVKLRQRRLPGRDDGPPTTHRHTSDPSTGTDGGPVTRTKRHRCKRK